MSCIRCGSPWDGTSRICPNCVARGNAYQARFTPSQEGPQVSVEAQILAKLDTIIFVLRDINTELCRQRLQGR
jgi:hypothetical protein